MKMMKFIAKLAVAVSAYYIFGLLLKEYPKIQSAIPYIFIAILYMRYETKIENLSMDLFSVEEQLEQVRRGEWECSIRFRGDPFNPS